tara:strand:- start:6777 stop:7355 length:579 start_codon:yes stop_codon:yes gene_type:complete
MIKFSEAWFKHRTLCGSCNFACCDGGKKKDGSFRRRGLLCLTEEEASGLQDNHKVFIQTSVYQEGPCSYLKHDGAGCMFGEDRPIHCKIYPLQLKQKREVVPWFSEEGLLVQSNFVFRNCPKPSDYEYIGWSFGQEVYRLKRNHYNKKKELRLDSPIEEEFKPHWRAFESELRAAYGDEWYENVKEVMENDN